MEKVAERFGVHTLYSSEVYDTVRGVEQIYLDKVK